MHPTLDDRTPRPTGAGSRRLRAVLVGLLVAVPFYAGGVWLGIGLVDGFSGNTHDRAVEAAMTGAFVVGPAAALVGFVVGALWYAGRKRGAAPPAGPETRSAE